MKVQIDPGLRWHTVRGKRFALGCIIDEGTGYRLVPVSWIDALFREVEAELSTSGPEALQPEAELVEEDLPEVRMSMEELTDSARYLKQVGVFTNRLLKDFYGIFRNQGPVAARQFVLEKHRKNPNTGRRRWNPPYNTEEDEEVIYETAFRVLLAMTGMEAENLYRFVRYRLGVNL